MRFSASRYQGALLIGLVLITFAMFIAPPYPDDLAIQHGPTLASAVALAWSVRRKLLSNFAFTAAIVFLCLHAVGGRYVYSFVPYDAWTKWLFGRSLSEAFDLHRNHYDRLVHFAFGLTIAWPLRELILRWARSTRAVACLFAFTGIVALAALYELGEWFAALTFAPDWADRYLGQQGDPWDAHHDMALAAAGAALSMTIAALVWAPASSPAGARVDASAPGAYTRRGE